MKRFVLYLVLIPIVAPLLVSIWQAATSAGDPFGLALRAPSLFFGLAYLNWLGQALCVAAVDPFQPFQDWRRFATILATGYVSTILVAGMLYGTFANAWRGAGLVGAIAALGCCRLLDQLHKERLAKFGSMFRTARRWPHRLED